MLTEVLLEIIKKLIDLATSPLAYFTFIACALLCLTISICSNHAHRRVLLLSGILLVGFASVSPEMIQEALKNDYREAAFKSSKCGEIQAECQKNEEKKIDEIKNLYLSLVSMIFGGVGGGLIAGALTIQATAKSEEEDVALIKSWINKISGPFGLYFLVCFSFLFVTSLINFTQDNYYQNKKMSFTLWLATLGTALNIIRHLLRGGKSITSHFAQLLCVVLMSLTLLIASDSARILWWLSPLILLLIAPGILAFLLRKIASNW
ncbi:hypothetical protein [Pseudomonas sp. HS-18]|uniref:hypothetical protein n=1 Tax=Pseudomonas sp. HS-18 TaxID=2879114 RepID=UPI001CF04C2D|nr:hypothetical protein [Pseudomonas sp. HS-18]UCL85736.1 hypothetical protein LDJ84_22710 [Pseudomonas sp. HS-18]